MPLCTESVMAAIRCRCSRTLKIGNTVAQDLKRQTQLGAAQMIFSVNNGKDITKTTAGAPPFKPTYRLQGCVGKLNRTPDPDQRVIRMLGQMKAKDRRAVGIMEVELAHDLGFQLLLDLVKFATQPDFRNPAGAFIS